MGERSVKDKRGGSGRRGAPHARCWLLTRRRQGERRLGWRDLGRRPEIVLVRPVEGPRVKVAQSKPGRSGWGTSSVGARQVKQVETVTPGQTGEAGGDCHPRPPPSPQQHFPSNRHLDRELLTVVVKGNEGFSLGCLPPGPQAGPLCTPDLLLLLKNRQWLLFAYSLPTP